MLMMVEQDGNNNNNENENEKEKENDEHKGFNISTCKEKCYRDTW